MLSRGLIRGGLLRAGLGVAIAHAVSFDVGSLASAFPLAARQIRVVSVTELGASPGLRAARGTRGDAEPLAGRGVVRGGMHLRSWCDGVCDSRCPPAYPPPTLAPRVWFPFFISSNNDTDDSEMTTS